MSARCIHGNTLQFACDACAAETDLENLKRDNAAKDEEIARLKAEIASKDDLLIETRDLHMSICLAPDIQHPNGVWVRCRLPAGHTDSHFCDGMHWVVDECGGCHEVEHLRSGIAAYRQGPLSPASAEWERADAQRRAGSGEVGADV